MRNGQKIKMLQFILFAENHLCTDKSLFGSIYMRQKDFNGHRCQNDIFYIQAITASASKEKKSK